MYIIAGNGYNYISNSLNEVWSIFVYIYDAKLYRLHTFEKNLTCTTTNQVFNSNPIIFYSTTQIPEPQLVFVVVSTLITRLGTFHKKNHIPATQTAGYMAAYGW